MRKATAALAAFAAALVAATAALGATGTNPTLAGETFAGPGPTITSFNCDLNGTSTFSYTVTGVATGPYPGTFTESVHVKIGPQTEPTYHVPYPGLRFGPVMQFDATFTIDSAVGQVTGTKTFLRNAPLNLTGGVCDTEHVPPPQNGTSLFFQADTYTTYRATIHSLIGTSTDSGEAFTASGGIVYIQPGFPNGGGGSFLEQFLISTGPLLPTSTEQCKGNGFESFGGAFKNQGDCVSFVVTGGKNEPGQNLP